MLIDGFTVVAQIINFLVLVLLLRRFLYGPIVRAMSEREAKIAAQLAEADALKRQARDEAAAYQQQREELQNQQEELLFKTKEEAEAWRKEFVNSARQEIEEARASWRKSIETEKQEFIQEVRQRIGRQVYAVSRRVLADLADAEVEQRIIGVFLRRIQELEEHERKTLIDSIQKSANRLLLRSAFEVSPAARQRILQVLRDDIAPEVEVHFEVEPNLLCGVEISVQDYKLAWTLDRYLVSLEESLFEALGEEAEREYAG